MTLSVYLPILLSAVLVLPARRLLEAARPEPLARVLAVCAVVCAVAGLAGLLLLAGTLFDDWPALALKDALAGGRLPEPVSDEVAVLAAGAVGWLLLRWRDQVRRERAAARGLHRAGAPGDDGLLVADWERPHAVAVPPLAGREGHVLVSRGLLDLLEPGERAAVLEHERAHLRLRHHRTAALVAWAAALNPLLAPVRDTVGLLLERSADEVAAASVGDRAPVARAIARVVLTQGELAVGGSDPVRRVRLLTGPEARPAPVSLAAAAAVALASAVALTSASADFLELVRVWAAPVA